MAIGTLMLTQKVKEIDLTASTQTIGPAPTPAPPQALSVPLLALQLSV